MDSADRITAQIEGLKGYIDVKLSEIDGKLTVLAGNVAELKTEIRVNAVRIEEVKNAVNWDFTVLAVIVAFVGFALTFAPVLRDMFSRKSDDEQMRKIAREVYTAMKTDGEAI